MKDPGSQTFTQTHLRPRQRRTGANHAAAEHRRAASKRKATLYQALRADHEAGLSGRALQRKHHVGYRTVGYALADPEPPTLKKKPDRASPHKHLRPHIDALLAANPQATAVTIWENLLDQHHATISYAALRTYLRRARRVVPGTGMP